MPNRGLILRVQSVGGGARRGDLEIRTVCGQVVLPGRASGEEVCLVQVGTEDSHIFQKRRQAGCRCWRAGVRTGTAMRWRVQRGEGVLLRKV